MVIGFSTPYIWQLAGILRLSRLCKHLIPSFLRNLKKAYAYVLVHQVKLLYFASDVVSICANNDLSKISFQGR